ncbi:MAG: sugar phosphate isomerase/epimerase family protein [Planctomycetota bacterium]|nr:sugar phosphate isomerase/epimerase family protein [Planctomycetota bacterium]
MELGFCTMGYLDYTTVEEAIRRIAKTGYKAIDFWAYSPHLGPDLYDKTKRREIKKQVKDAGLKTVALSVNGGGLALHINFSHCIEQIRNSSVEYYKQCVDLAKDIDCPLINMISGHMVYGTTRQQAWEWNRQCMKEVALYAGEKDVQVALHTLTPCESQVMVTLDDALRMMEEINSPSCKVMIDTADQNITDPNLCDAIRKAGKDLVYVHCNDNSGVGQGDVHLPPGRGTVTMEHLLGFGAHRRTRVTVFLLWRSRRSTLLTVQPG